jgi:hypothetical protein
MVASTAPARMNWRDKPKTSRIWMHRSLVRVDPDVLMLSCTTFPLSSLHLSSSRCGSFSSAFYLKQKRISLFGTGAGVIDKEQYLTTEAVFIFIFSWRFLLVLSVTEAFVLLYYPSLSATFCWVFVYLERITSIFVTACIRGCIKGHSMILFEMVKLFNANLH